MLQLRIEGDEDESRALVDALRAAGIEVQIGTVKHRREGFSHLYAMVRLPDWPPAAPGPVRAYASIDRAALAAGRQPARRPR